MKLKVQRKKCHGNKLRYPTYYHSFVKGTMGLLKGVFRVAFGIMHLRNELYLSLEWLWNAFEIIPGIEFVYLGI